VSEQRMNFWNCGFSGGPTPWRRLPHEIALSRFDPVAREMKRAYNEEIWPVTARELMQSIDAKQFPDDLRTILILAAGNDIADRIMRLQRDLARLSASESAE